MEKNINNSEKSFLENDTKNTLSSDYKAMINDLLEKHRNGHLEYYNEEVFRTRTTRKTTFIKS